MREEDIMSEIKDNVTQNTTETITIPIQEYKELVSKASKGWKIEFKNNKFLNISFIADAVVLGYFIFIQAGGIPYAYGFIFIIIMILMGLFHNYIVKNGLMALIKFDISFFTSIIIAIVINTLLLFLQ
nr:MAG TPA: hypothetical protein [Caudoviricetes sp.]